MAERIYLDHAATTPMRPEAIAAVAEGMARWANPSSPHAEGRAARAALESARDRIKAALGWNGELIFTSGASEALALAASSVRVDKRHVSAVEHDAALRAMAGGGVVRASPSGLVDLDDFDGPALVAIQAANGETGVIQPPEVGPATRVRRCAWLADCSQTAGKLPLPDADLIVVSAHKLGGPPGIGALLVHDLGMLEPAGGQERGYRGGTENLPGALGFAAALEAPRDWFAGTARLRALLESAIVAAGGEIVAGAAPRLPTVGAYRMPGVAAAAQLIRFDLAGFAVSAGSACASGSLRSSHVLRAMGFPDEEASEVIRVSFGWTTTEAEVVAFTETWTGIARMSAKAA